MKRSFEEIRKGILRSLSKGPKSITAIAKDIKSTWLTAKRHLEWLEFKKKVKVVRKSKRGIIYKRVV